MKKFLKAVALATVMCMLLSVSAFAAVETVDGVGTYEQGETATITIIGSGTEQVALLVVDSDVVSLENVEDDDIKYIGQEAADDNTATFTVKVDQGIKVDIYAGAASFTDGAKQLANDITLYPNDKIVLTNTVMTKNMLGEGQDKTGFGAAITVTIPKGITVDRMVWALTVDNKQVYSNPVEVTGVEGSVQFAAVFANGQKSLNIATKDVTAVNAIFHDTNNSDHYTNEDLDKENKVE